MIDLVKLHGLGNDFLISLTSGSAELGAGGLRSPHRYRC